MLDLVYLGASGLIAFVVALTWREDYAAAVAWPDEPEPIPLQLQHTPEVDDAP